MGLYAPELLFGLFQGSSMYMNRLVIIRLNPIIRNHYLYKLMEKLMPRKPKPDK